MNTETTFTAFIVSESHNFTESAQKHNVLQRALKLIDSIHYIRQESIVVYGFIVVSQLKRSY